MFSAGFFHQFTKPITARHVGFFHYHFSTMLLKWKEGRVRQEEFLGLEASLHMFVSFIFSLVEVTLLVLGIFLRPLGGLSLRLYSLEYQVTACLL